MKEKNYKCVLTKKEIKEYLQNSQVAAFDFECSPTWVYSFDKNAALDPHKSEIVGISLSVEEGTGIYIPLRHFIGENVEDIDEIMDYLRESIFENSHVTKIAHNIAYEASFLYKYGIVLKSPVYDTLCASQLTLKNDTEFRKLKDSGLKTLVPEIFYIDLPSFTEVTKGGNFSELNPQHKETIRYACADSDFALRLYNRFNAWFRTYMPKHEYICREIESPTAVYTGIMKYNGISVNKGLMLEKQVEAQEKLDKLKRRINSFAGRDINIGANASTKDFKSFLYDELKLPVLKTTAKFQEAANDEAFILLKDWCRDKRPEVVSFIEDVQKYRKWSKIKSTYIDGFLKCINSATGNIHTDFFPMGTDTGRFSSRNPNLQNLPRKDNDPIGVRKFFIPSKGHVFIDFDFSQVELRVGAYFCGDRRMIETYRNDGDIHGLTTTVIFNIPFNEAVNKNAKHYKERRTIAKNCNFGVFFGLYPRGLQRTLKFKASIQKREEECKAIIDNIKRGYPGLMKWQIITKKRAALRKYSETALGRRRILKGIDSPEWSVKSYWERCALNTPIQGTAADILKLSIGRILSELKERPYIKPVLQVHDELLFEVKEEKIQEAVEFIKESMEKLPFEGFHIPIKAEGEMGMSFGEMEEIKYEN